MADNVLWIITDYQMRSTLHTMDRTWKRLVRKGVRFPYGYAAMPWCGPARASMLTSSYAHVATTGRPTARASMSVTGIPSWSPSRATTLGRATMSARA